MERYVRQGYKREEALDFLKRDFPMYACNIRQNFTINVFIFLDRTMVEGVARRRLEKYFKEHLALLKNRGHYDSFNESDR